MMAYPGLWRMAAKQWRYAIGEFHRSLSKSAFVRELQRLVPEVTESDVVPDGSGVRGQALRRDGLLVDDFEFAHAENILHLWNVPSPAATASLPVGKMGFRL